MIYKRCMSFLLPLIVALNCNVLLKAGEPAHASAQVPVTTASTAPQEAIPSLTRTQRAINFCKQTGNLWLLFYTKNALSNVFDTSFDNDNYFVNPFSIINRNLTDNNMLHLFSTAYGELVTHIAGTEIAENLQNKYKLSDKEATASYITAYVLAQCTPKPRFLLKKITGRETNRERQNRLEREERQRQLREQREARERAEAELRRQEETRRRERLRQAFEREQEENNRRRAARVAEEQRKKDEEQKRQAEMRRQQEEAQRLAREAEEKSRKEREAARRDEELRKKQAEELKRQEEIKRKAEAERREKELQQQRAREAEEKMRASQEKSHHTHSSSDPSQTRSNDCSICFEPMNHGSNTIKTSCSHTFHTSCLKKWITQGKESCPHCRKPVPAASVHRWDAEQNNNDFFKNAAKKFFNTPAEEEKKEEPKHQAPRTPHSFASSTTSAGRHTHDFMYTSSTYFASNDNGNEREARQTNRSDTPSSFFSSPSTTFRTPTCDGLTYVTCSNCTRRHREESHHPISAFSLSIHCNICHMQHQQELNKRKDTQERPHTTHTSASSFTSSSTTHTSARNEWCSECGAFDNRLISRARGEPTICLNCMRRRAEEAVRKSEAEFNKERERRQAQAELRRQQEKARENERLRQEEKTRRDKERYDEELRKKQAEELKRQEEIKRKAEEAERREKELQQQRAREAEEKARKEREVRIEAERRAEAERQARLERERKEREEKMAQERDAARKTHRQTEEEKSEEQAWQEHMRSIKAESTRNASTKRTEEKEARSNYDDKKNDAYTQAFLRMLKPNPFAAMHDESAFRSLGINVSANAYTVLGIQRTATNDEIYNAYKKLAKIWHPNNLRTGNDAAFKLIQDAYDLLKAFRKF